MLKPQLTSKEQILCVEGIYVRDGKVLLLKRASEPFQGLWSLIGGQVEKNETLTEALEREFNEETNLEVDVGDLLGERLEETSDRIKRILTFRIVSVRGKIRLNPENEKHRWFKKVPSNSVYDYASFLTKIYENSEKH